MWLLNDGKTQKQIYGQQSVLQRDVTWNITEKYVICSSKNVLNTKMTVSVVAVKWHKKKERHKNRFTDSNLLFKETSHEKHTVSREYSAIFAQEVEKKEMRATGEGNDQGVTNAVLSRIDLNRWHHTTCLPDVISVHFVRHMFMGGCMVATYVYGRIYGRNEKYAQKAARHLYPIYVACM